MLTPGEVPAEVWNAEHRTNVSNRLRPGNGYKLRRSPEGTTLAITRQSNGVCPHNLIVTPEMSGGSPTGTCRSAWANSRMLLKRSSGSLARARNSTWSK